MKIKGILKSTKGTQSKSLRVLTMVIETSVDEIESADLMDIHKHIGCNVDCDMVFGELAEKDTEKAGTSVDNNQMILGLSEETEQTDEDESNDIDN